VAFRNTPRYPEISPNMTMDEIARRWSELVRALNQRDTSPLNPTEIYGRNIGVGGVDNENAVFVTAGTSLAPLTPTNDLWYVYQYQIPQDVGMVFVEPVSVSATANVQVQTFLPLAQSVPGRTITIAGGNPDGIAFNSFNLAVFPTSGSGDTLQLTYGGGVSVQVSVTGGSLNVDTTVSSTFGGAAITNNTTTSVAASIAVNTTVASMLSGAGIVNNTTASVSVGGTIVNNTVTSAGGSFAVDVTTATILVDSSGNPVPTGFPIYSFDASSGQLHPTFAVSIGTSTAELKSNILTTSFQNTTTTSAAITVNAVTTVSSTFTGSGSIAVSVSSSFSGGAITNNTTTSGSFSISVDTTVSSSIGAGAITNNTTTSASLTLNTVTSTVFNTALNYTFRAFGNKWIQIA
jgi:hypothetical protein